MIARQSPHAAIGDTNPPASLYSRFLGLNLSVSSITSCKNSVLLRAWAMVAVHKDLFAKRTQFA
jgi:hypothetical protein